MRTALAAAALAAAAFAVPATAGPEVPKIGACVLVPMQYPDVVDEAVAAVYATAPPVRDAVWTVCAL